ncbi:extensin-like [Penaeus monodon]|uniref:extensin-like n=1 Tax=Penaeus monodon TaxID=6687 RepID=UPI0018A6E2CB|nr:extensin-like [Penaeus monodon]
MTLKIAIIVCLAVVAVADQSPYPPPPAYGPPAPYHPPPPAYHSEPQYPDVPPQYTYNYGGRRRILRRQLRPHRVPRRLQDRGQLHRRPPRRPQADRQVCGQRRRSCS